MNSPPLSQYVDESTLASLHRVLPGVALEPTVKPLSWSKLPAVSIELPAAPGADYRFILTLQPERQIHAKLIQAGDTPNNFWYRPFEDAEFGDSIEKLDEAFFETIERLVLHETRIVQKRGLFTNSFLCDYKSPAGWKQVSGNSSLRSGGIDPPRLTGKQRVYRSPALL